MTMESTIHAILDAIHNGEDGSIHLTSGEAPKTGYMVGGASWTMTVAPEMLDAYVIADFIHAHKAMLSWEHHFIGWWTHNGRIYLDVSENVHHFSHALELGYERKELAIFDLNTMTEVAL